LIVARIKALGDWRGETLSDPRPDQTSRPRGYRRGESNSRFSKGAQLRDPSKLFNSSLEGNVRRAIDLREGDKVDHSAFKALIRDA
jgi:hypothetical protein